MERLRRDRDARQPVAAYREFAPCKALRGHVYAFFSFVPATASAASNRILLREALFTAGDSFCSPLLADGNISIVLGLGRLCDAAGRWHDNPAGPTSQVIGPMTVVGAPSPQERPEMVGVYFRAAQAWPFLHMPISTLSDKVVGVDDVWGDHWSRLLADLSDRDEAARVDRLEAVLLEQLARHRGRMSNLDAAGLASMVMRCGGQISVEHLAHAAGVSRQHLTRAFHERVGVAPKTFCSLARFQSGLAYVERTGVSWATAAAALGYADQSHMISEFRRFSGMTPQTLAASVQFHPFIWRARERWPSPEPALSMRPDLVGPNRAI